MGRNTNSQIIVQLEQVFDALPRITRPATRRAMVNLKALLTNYHPPAIVSDETCRKLAQELALLDGLSRWTSDPEENEACSIVACRELYKAGFRLKHSAAPRASELNAMSARERDEWAANSAAIIDKLRAQQAPKETLQ